MDSTGSKHLKTAIAGLAPVAVLIVLVYSFLSGGSSLQLPGAQLPIEELTIERIELLPEEIRVHVVNSGPSEVTVAQVLVNEAIWDALASPSNVIPRLGRASLSLPFNWVEGEPYEVTLITSNGFDFSAEVQAAVLTPLPTLDQFVSLAIVGVYVGVVPVFLGLTWLPFLRRIGVKWFRLFISLTVGLLIFLGVDALEEALNLANLVPGPFQGAILIASGVLISFLALVAVGTTSLGKSAAKEKSLLALAYLIALGIGLHNLGEGLAIGAAYAVGEVALGTFLILGFTIHNTTEGVAIVAPISKRRTPLYHLGLLGVLAGAPTILGAWIGGFIFSPLWAVLFLAIGAGAIFNVVYDLVGYLSRGKSAIKTFGEPFNLAGLILGFLVMYTTALLVPV
ncbi:MAG: ZIP family metal transporter [Candidatus Geothermarchaeales archaeon]